LSLKTKFFTLTKIKINRMGVRYTFDDSPAFLEGAPCEDKTLSFSFSSLKNMLSRCGQCEDRMGVDFDFDFDY